MKEHTYKIIVEEQVDSKLSDWFCEMNLTHTGEGNTILLGQIADQAALHGILHKVRDLGLTLISLSRVDHESEIGRSKANIELHESTTWG